MRHERTDEEDAARLAALVEKLTDALASALHEQGYLHPGERAEELLTDSAVARAISAIQAEAWNQGWVEGAEDPGAYFNAAQGDFSLNPYRREGEGTDGD